MNNDRFDGDMTIHLSTGLDIRVPNSQFLTPFVDIARGGSRVFNNSVKELLVNGVGNQPATLGRYFFTSAYLMVNQEKETFTLWQANPSNSSTITAVHPESDGACSDQEDQTGGTDIAPGQGEEGQQGVPKGIIGGVVAAVVVVALGVAGLYFFVRHRRKKTKTFPSNEATAQEKAGAQFLSYGQGPFQTPHEVASEFVQHVPRSELSGNHTFVHELDGVNSR